MLAVLVAAATPALADDNGMTPHYGDSWAQLQARDPSASTVPSIVEQPTTDLRSAWSNTWNGMRERTSRTWHRMTGPGYANTDAEHQPTTGRAPALGGYAGTDAEHQPTTGRAPALGNGTASDGYGAPAASGSAATSGAYVAPDVNARGTNLPDAQAAPAEHADRGVAPGPAAADAARNAAGQQPMPTNRGRAGPLGEGSGGTVDPTGAGAATMGGSPYGGNQDPSRLDNGTSAPVGKP
jgi:hypothetical protein